jgi:hypothetical protein
VSAVPDDLAAPAVLVSEPPPQSTPLLLSREQAADAPARSERKPRRAGRRVCLYLSPGQYLADRYEVLRVVGEGGMGVVYACRDKAGALCAVKRVVLPEANADESLAWFVAEAQALAALNHENIVKARDFGQLRDGTPYLVMDLVEGVSLQQILGDVVDWKLLWSLIDQVLSALSHAHARGIVHGDLKPANVIVDFDDHGRERARLFDFGLAKRRRVDLDPRLGQRGAPCQPPSNAGTPGYMAPEQLLGRASEISSATDLYALGCILYRVLAGRAPVVHEGQRPLDFQAFHEPEPPSVTAQLPHGLLPFVRSLLEPKPWLRVASAAEVRRQFQAFRPGNGASCGVLLPAPDGGRLERAVTLATTARVEPAPAGRQLFRLCRSRSWPPGLLGIRASPLVGRDDVCHSLRELYAGVARGEAMRCSAVLLEGISGVGKSRLAEQLCTEVEEQGTGVALRGYRPHQFRGRDPLALALADRFELGGRALRILPSGLAHRCDERDLGTVVDWVLCSSDPLAQRRTPDLALAGCAARVLSVIADDRTLVLWLDELCELRAETVELLAALPRLAPALRVLLLLTARPGALDEVGSASALRRLASGFEFSTLHVTPLDVPVAAAMLQAAHPIEPELALELARESGGVPLSGLQRLHALARAGKFA